MYLWRMLETKAQSQEYASLIRQQEGGRFNGDVGDPVGNS